MSKEKASANQVSLAIELSERKNTPEAHYDLIINQGSLTKSSARFEIERLSFRKEIVSRKVYDMNVKISEDPQWFKQQSEERAANQNDIMHNHLIERFNKGDIGDKSIVYIELGNDPHLQKLMKSYPWDIEQDIKDYIAHVGKDSSALIDPENLPVDEGKIKVRTLSSEEVNDLFEEEEEKEVKEVKEELGDLSTTSTSININLTEAELNALEL